MDNTLHPVAGKAMTGDKLNFDGLKEILNQNKKEGTEWYSKKKKMIWWKKKIGKMKMIGKNKLYGGK